MKVRLLKYLTNFFKNRKIITIVNGISSGSASVENEIVQGLAIGTTRFNSRCWKPRPPRCWLYNLCRWPHILHLPQGPKDTNDILQKTIDYTIYMYDTKNGCWKTCLKKPKVLFSPEATRMLILPQILVGKLNVKFKNCLKLLSTTLDKKLRWKYHVEEIIERCAGYLNALSLSLVTNGEQIQPP